MKKMIIMIAKEIIVMGPISKVIKKIKIFIN